MTEQYNAPYPWPEKEHFIEALKVYLKYKHNEEKYREKVRDILYVPFTGKTAPSALRDIPILQSDLDGLKINFTNFLVDLSKIGKVVPEIDLHVGHDINQTGGKPVFVLTVSLKPEK